MYIKAEAILQHVIKAYELEEKQECENTKTGNADPDDGKPLNRDSSSFSDFLESVASVAAEMTHRCQTAATAVLPNSQDMLFLEIGR